MFDFPNQPTQIHHFISDQAEALQNAALLLGGRRWLRRVQHLIDDMRARPELTRRMTGEAMQLRALLHLEHVHDPERMDAACFAELDPEAGYVADICLLADGLDEAIDDAFRETGAAWLSTEEVL